MSHYRLGDRLKQKSCAKPVRALLCSCWYEGNKLTPSLRKLILILFLIRYPEFRDEQGHFTSFYWHLLALRLGFVIMFEVRGKFICIIFFLIIAS